MPITITKRPVTSKAGSPATKTSPAARLPGRFRTLPPTLSHYTNLTGMMGIIDNCEIWASNVSFLNDRRELLHGLDAAVAVVKEFSSKRTSVEWRKPLNIAVSQLEDGEMPNTYAACFCEKSDLLNQWRGYGGSEQGISITFDRVRLASKLKATKASLFPVVYGNLKTNEQITKELSDRLDDLDEDAELIGGYTEEQRVKKVHSVLSRLLPQFKHIGFEHEREWRFVVQQESMRPTVCFRASSNVLVPYLKLSLGENSGLPIRYIRVGPGRDQELTKRSIELYLKSKGYADDIAVVISKVPFRL